MQKKYRLKNRRSFKYIYSKGKTISNEFLSLIYVPSAQQLKIGFSVSKKIGNSVVRNKIRRRLKETCRIHINYFPNYTNYVFIAKSKIVDLEFLEIWQVIEKMLSKVNNKAQSQNSSNSNKKEKINDK